MSSGMLRRVVWYELTDVSDELTASFIRAMRMFVNKVLMKISGPERNKQYKCG
jgi:hypothetical protein